MFLLYAVAGGIVAGYALGGRLDRLAAIEFRWAPLALVGLLVQLALFSPLGGRLPETWIPIVYIASTATVLAVVIRNARLPGLLLVAVGATANLLAIVTNGGYMPADPDALASLGMAEPSGPTNSVASARPVLRILTDIFALPGWLPLANVFSIGDILVAVGIAVAIAVGMRRPAPDRPVR